MKRPNKKIMIELEELVGRDNFEALTREYGGTFIYIPRISKYDRRVEYLRNVHYMRGYLEYGVPVDEIVTENRLTKYQRRFLEGLVKFCLNRYITSYKSLLAAVDPFCGKNTESILLLIGAAAFAALLEQYSGRRLYIPVLEESRSCSSKSQTHNSLETDIFFDLSDGLSLEETAVKNKTSLSKVKSIAKMYGINSNSEGADHESRG